MQVSSLPTQRTSALEVGSKILEQPEQMVGIDRRGDKVEVFIERLGLIVFCVNGECANASDIGGLKCSKHCVLEKAGPQTFPLPRDRNGKTGKQHDGHRMASEPFGQAFRCVDVFNVPHHQSVVADNAFICQGNVRLRRSCLLVLKCIADQEATKGFLTAVKRADLVAALQFFDAE